MRYTIASFVVLAAVSNASPLPQFSIPSFGSGFSIPSFPLPTGGSGFSFGIPSFGGSLPTATAGIGGGLPSSVQATTTAAATPTSTESAGGDAVGSACTPQGSGGGTTEDGVKNKNCCTDLTVVYARGTTESGNVGFVAGPPMFKSLRTKLGADRVTIQGVDYPADAAGNANGGASGGPAMAESVKAALSQCPSTKVVVSGYSQGGMVVHNAFSAQGLSSSQVQGAVLFGDPFISQKVGNLADAKVKEFCGSSDPVCGKPTGDVNGGHTAYGSVADAAADFVIQAAGLTA